ncbi:DEAD/DEAH box helicase [Hymenobacter sp. J193]|uniref:DEAD/DEAH box helicase n=1 Tax=Hymenobacter sp. J193 TaxID=2898429 RepID=UPI002151D996|nr:DEAD/DEAH box helicase [Hymenobacter sp. J193]MCR5886681.1 DEAD/DEAH box helicase [Hymenobacter sp. J193]
MEFAPEEAEQVHKTLHVNPNEFTEQDADFTLALPYPWFRTPLSPPVHGIVVEIDGSQHLEPSQRQKDARRDWATEQAHWLTARLPSAEFGTPQKALRPLREAVEQHEYFAHLAANYEQPMYASTAGLQAQQLLLTPLAVARLQRTLLECISNGLLPLHKSAWHLVIVEHDVPCAHLSVEALQELMLELFDLEGRERHLPEIRLQVFASHEYLHAALHTAPGHAVQPLSMASLAAPADLVLDVAMLQRPGFTPSSRHLPGQAYVSIRSAYAPRAARRFQTAALVAYPPIVQEYDREDEYEYPELPGRKEPLLYFLQNIFRKADFREGQLPILNRGLQGRSVLGLLPTGGGKSLTYQLAALLQPGVALVVDPIKSLMQDQYEGLQKNWIDATSYVNSSIRTATQRELRLRRLSRGELLFFFISPERMMIQSFRQQLQRMRSPDRVATRVGFNYCVIDEAHCVSEWGHDFRTQYLRLGDNARAYCHTFNGKSVPLYGLTATASFDVLADVERELRLDPDDVVRTRTTERRELSYRIIDVKTNESHRHEKDPLGAAKHQELRHLLQNLPYSLEERIATAEEARFIPRSFQSDSFYQEDEGRYPHAGLIFCPYKSERHAAGVRSIHTMLQNVDTLPLRVGYFMGSDQNDTDKDSAQNEMERMQTRFVSDQLNLLVATKAFGMGIDKPNVRFTIHYNFPGSIESFVQEAGRAGRDRAYALNYVLFHEADRRIQEQFHQNSFKGRKKEALVMHELLSRVTFPALQQCAELAEYLQETFSLPVTVSLFPRPGQGEPRFLYVNQSFGVGYGRVDFSNPKAPVASLTNKHESISVEQAQALLDWLVQYLLEETPDDALASQATLAEWLATRTSASSTLGIVPKLSQVAIGERPNPLTIGFVNGSYSEMAEIAASYGWKLTEPLLKQAAAYTTTDQEFLNNLRQQLTPEPPKEVFDALRRNYPRIREEQDTYKAVHRLCLLGVVEDYTIDYGARTLTLLLAPRPATDQHYLDRLEDYFRRYTTATNARQLCEQTVQREKGETLLEKCLGQVLDFTYSEIAAKRRQAILEMENACRNGLKGDDLSEFFDLYFNSKYARPHLLPEDTKQGTHFDQEILWKYLKYMAEPPDGLGKEKDNIKHLRGACARLLQAAPNNGALLLLDGFAMLLLEKHKPPKKVDPRLEEVGRRKIRDGLVAFYEQTQLTETELNELARRYATEISHYEPSLGPYVLDHVVDSILVDINSKWLLTFNKRFDNRTSLA